MDAWERERVAMTDKRRRVRDCRLYNNNDIVRAKSTARTEVLVQGDEMRQCLFCEWRS
jgi:hypothetical protein